MTKLERQILWIGYIMSGVGGALIGRAFAESYDWKILAAYFCGGLGAVIIGSSKS